PSSILPPGNSHWRARCLPAGRWATNNRPARSIRAQHTGTTRVEEFSATSPTVAQVGGKSATFRRRCGFWEHEDFPAHAAQNRSGGFADLVAAAPRPLDRGAGGG